MELGQAIEALRGIEVLDAASLAHEEAVVALTAAGFHCVKEFAVATPEGRGGRIDIVAYKDGGILAIEIDHRKPRKRSIQKMQLVPGAKRIAVLRGVEWIAPLPDGLDAIVGIRVRDLRAP